MKRWYKWDINQIINGTIFMSKGRENGNWSEETGVEDQNWIRELMKQHKIPDVPVLPPVKSKVSSSAIQQDSVDKKSSEPTLPPVEEVLARIQVTEKTTQESRKSLEEAAKKVTDEIANETKTVKAVSLPKTTILGFVDRAKIQTSPDGFLSK